MRQRRCSCFSRICRDRDTRHVLGPEPDRGCKTLVVAIVPVAGQLQAQAQSGVVGAAKTVLADRTLEPDGEQAGSVAAGAVGCRRILLSPLSQRALLLPRTRH